MNAEKNLIYDNLRIYPGSRTVYVGEQEIFLTRMEFDVLYFLASNPNLAFTKEQIYEAVSRDVYVESAYVIKNVIYHLRKKLGIDNIQTLHGYGYKFNPKSETVN